MASPDLKPIPRRRDPGLLRILHASSDKDCCLCGTTERLELHHVLARGAGRGDDVRENLVWLCSEDHRRITGNECPARRALGRHLLKQRWDVLFYIEGRFGKEAASDWLARHLFIEDA